MTPIRQLLRQPVRLIAVLLLLTMAASFFSLSAGVFASAQNTLEEIERNYITIATPTLELVMTEVEPTIGSTAVTHESQISSEMWRYMDTLADSKTLIRGANSQKFISAYSPSFRTVISTEKNGAYAANLDEPYNRAIFVIRVVSMTKDEYPFFPPKSPQRSKRSYGFILTIRRARLCTSLLHAIRRKPTMRSSLPPASVIC